MPAVSLSLLCQLVSGTTLGPYVLKAGDTMTGALTVPTTTGLKVGGVTSAFSALTVSSRAAISEAVAPFAISCSTTCRT